MTNQSIILFYFIAFLVLAMIIAEQMTAVDEDNHPILCDPIISMQTPAISGANHLAAQSTVVDKLSAELEPEPK